MCDPNINELLNINFSDVNDEFNWLNNTTIPIETINGQLRLIPQSSTSQFTRSLGVLDPANNRINLQINLDVFRPQTSPDSVFCAKIETFNGSTLIGTYTIYLDELLAGQRTEYNIERVYKYEGLSGPVSMKITTIEGWGNQMFLDYIKSSDQKYCDDNVRAFFALEDVFEEILNSESSAFQLLEWKVDNVETLTPDFFTENNSPGGNPIADWFFAKANIDGSNRVANTVDPNTFNPFISELGLDFSPTNYFDGKPTGTTSSSDYGSGILNIGFGKPTILNGNLENRQGCFFIDMDLTKELKIVFNLLVNNINSSVFDSPNVYRKYTILWSVAKCEGTFYYQDVLNNNQLNDQGDNGFLFGLTGIESSLEQVGCDESFQYQGNAGVFEFTMDFGLDIGVGGINYNAFGVPDKFEIEWNGNIVTTGFVGDNGSDQALLNLGYNPIEINTGNPSTGQGILNFNKTLAQPRTAIIRVTAPLGSTFWGISGRCIEMIGNIRPTVEISSLKNSVPQGNNMVFNVVSNDVDGTIANWFCTFGNEGQTSGIGAPPPTLSKVFNSLGAKNISITVFDNEGAIGSDVFQITVVGSNQYSITGQTTVNCGSASGIDGVLNITSGTVTVKNQFTLSQGTFIGVDISINGGNLGNGQSVVLGVGSYPFTSGLPDCTSGNGSNEITFI